MSFTSHVFLAFLAVVVLLYFLVPLKYQWLVLLAGSLSFYYMAGKQFLPFIIGTAVISYTAARLIDNKNEETAAAAKNAADKEAAKQIKTAGKQYCRRIMTLSLVLIIGYLCCTKFLNGALRLLNHALNNQAWTGIHLIVPLGISYYTFSTVGYVLDIYWKRYKAEKNFLKYLLYVMYFPHIMLGPIARFDRLGKQLWAGHPFDYRRFCFGIQLMLWGFFEKLMIADRLGIFVGNVIDSWQDKAGSVLLVAVLFYAAQIYTDFAGCVNIAMGMSQIFGIRLDENFRQPYFSRSVEEFWRRWHITLGAWFRDYLCMPVSVSASVKKWSKSARQKWGAQAGKNVTTIAALVAVWICTGAWHGTGLNYVLWGIWQCSIIVFSTLMEDRFKVIKTALRINEQAAAWKLFQIVRTFILTGIIPRVVTRAPSLSAAWNIFVRIPSDFKAAYLGDGTLYQFGLGRMQFWLGIMSLLVLFLVSLCKEHGMSIRERIAGLNIVLRWGIYLAAFMTVAVFGVYGEGSNTAGFLYVRF